MQKIKLPEDFIKNINTLLGEKEASQLIESLESDIQITSIRLNNAKKLIYNTKLNHFDTNKKVPFLDTAYYLDQRPLFIADPLWHSASYYVQEASSMSINCIKNILGDKALKALDLSAAPGGKSTLLRDILPKDSILVANEPITNRALILKENLQKWGDIDTIVCSEYPDKFEKIGEYFDLILVDAPCSGEGMFRKDHNARKEWSNTLVQQCQDRQRNIIDSAVKLLKDDGIFIYSTCTFNREENEDNVEYIADTYGYESIKLEELENLGLKSNFSNLNAYRFMPHKFEGEGLFLSVFRRPKKEQNTKEQKRKSKNKRDLLDKKLESLAKSYIKKDCKIILEKDTLWAMTPNCFDTFEILENAKIRMLSKGLEIAYIKANKLLPSTALALSNTINESKFISKNVDLETALRVLRGETININEDNDLDKGFILLKYNKTPFAFVKNIGNRANNLYPNSWRILKSIEELLKN